MKQGKTWVLLICLFFAAAFLLIRPSGVFWIVDGGNKFLAAVNLGERNHTNFEIEYPGRSFDPDLNASPLVYPFFTVKQKKIFSVFPPLFAWLSSFMYGVFGFFGIFLLPLAGGLLSAYLVLGIASEADLSRKMSLACGAAVFFCTPNLFYTVCFWEHTLANTAVLFALYMVVRFIKTGKASVLFYSGLAMGAGISMREEISLFSAAFFFALMADKEARKKLFRVFFFPLGLLAGLIPVLGFQKWAYGKILGNHVTDVTATSETLNLENMKEVLAERWEVVEIFLAKASANPTAAFFYVFLFVAMGVFAFCSRKKSSRDALVILLGSLILAVFSGLIFILSHEPFEAWLEGNGLFVHASILLPAMAGYIYKGKKPCHRLFRHVRNSVFLFILFICLSAPVILTRGLHWGPRYLLSIFPMLLILTFVSFEYSFYWEKKSFRSIVKMVFVLLLMVSFLVQVYSLTVLYEKLETSDQFKEQVMACQEEAVVTDIWSIPQDLASIFYEKKFFYVKASDQKNLDALLLRFKEKGIKTYLYITGRPIDETPIWRGDSSIKLLNAAIYRLGVD